MKCSILFLSLLLATVTLRAGNNSTLQIDDATGKFRGPSALFSNGTNIGISNSTYFGNANLTGAFSGNGGGLTNLQGNGSAFTNLLATNINNSTPAYLTNSTNTIAGIMSGSFTGNGSQLTNVPFIGRIGLQFYGAAAIVGTNTCAVYHANGSSNVYNAVANTALARGDAVVLDGGAQPKLTNGDTLILNVGTHDGSDANNGAYQNIGACLDLTQNYTCSNIWLVGLGSNVTSLTYNVELLGVTAANGCFVLGSNTVIQDISLTSYGSSIPILVEGPGLPQYTARNCNFVGDLDVLDQNNYVYFPFNAGGGIVKNTNFGSYGTFFGCSFSGNYDLRAAAGTNVHWYFNNCSFYADIGGGFCGDLTPASQARSCTMEGPNETIVDVGCVNTTVNHSTTGSSPFTVCTGVTLWTNSTFTAYGDKFNVIGAGSNLMFQCLSGTAVVSMDYQTVTNIGYKSNVIVALLDTSATTTTNIIAPISYFLSNANTVQTITNDTPTGGFFFGAVSNQALLLPTTVPYAGNGAGLTNLEIFGSGVTTNVSPYYLTINSGGGSGIATLNGSGTNTTLVTPLITGNPIVSNPIGTLNVYTPTTIEAQFNISNVLGGESYQNFRTISGGNSQINWVEGHTTVDWTISGSSSTWALTNQNTENADFSAFGANDNVSFPASVTNGTLGTGYVYATGSAVARMGSTTNINQETNTWTGTNTFTNTVIATNAQSTSQFAGTFTGNTSGITNDVKITGTNMMGVPTNIFAGGWTNVSGTTGSTNFATGTYTNVFSSNGTISFIGAANTNTMGANGFTNATATITNVYGTATGTFSNISATASNTYGPNGQSNVFAGSTRFSVSVNGPQTLAQNIVSTSTAMVSGDFAAASGSATLKDSGISLTSAVFSNATVTANFTNNALLLYSNVQVTANSATTIYWTNLPARQCVAIPLIVMTNSATSPALALISESNASTGVIVTNPPIYAETFATIALSTNGANIDMGSNDTLIFTLTGCQTNIQIGLKYR